MQVRELSEDKVINNWLRVKKAAVNTRRSYHQAMQLYTDFTGLSPTELLDEAETEQIGVSSVPMRRRKINDKILDSRDFL